MAKDNVPSANQLLSANKAGEILGVSGKTIIRMMGDGEFPGYKIGATWKFKRGEIEAYIESKKFRGKQNDNSAA